MYSMSFGNVDCSRLLAFCFNFFIRSFIFLVRVVALDMRGYGDSDKPQKLENYALDNLIEDTPAVIKALGECSCWFLHSRKMK